MARLETFALGQLYPPPVDAALLSAILNYEREAATYALEMLHQVGIAEIDQWLSHYTQCDMACLQHYYRTGETKQCAGFGRNHAALVELRCIPAFVPTQRLMRDDGHEGHSAPGTAGPEFESRCPANRSDRSVYTPHARCPLRKRKQVPQPHPPGGISY